MPEARPRSSWTTLSTKNMSDGNFFTPIFLMGLLGSKGLILHQHPRHDVAYVPRPHTLWMTQASFVTHEPACITQRDMIPDA